MGRLVESQDQTMRTKTRTTLALALVALSAQAFAQTTKPTSKPTSKPTVDRATYAWGIDQCLHLQSLIHDDVLKYRDKLIATGKVTNVLLAGQGPDVTIGTPHLPDTRVEAQIVDQKRGKKIIIFKHKRRKNYRRKQGHRQYLTSLKITGIHAEAAATEASADGSTAS